MFLALRYIDLDLVHRFLDHFGIEVRVSTSVEETTADDRARNIGVNKVVSAGAGSEHRVERREAFNRKVQPEGLVSAAIDAARCEMIDLDSDPDSVLVKGGFVLVTGEISMSPVSELPQLVRPLLSSFLLRPRPPQLRRSFLMLTPLG